MLFSIIVPVYNVEEYLPECLDSIIRQTEQDFEVVLVDDGSIDGSGAICDEYAKKNPYKFRVFHSENNGALLARRVGIEKAKGEYFLFVDSDDYISDLTLSIVKDTIIKYNCDLVIYNRNNFSREGKMTKLPPVFEDGETFESEGKQKLFRIFLLGYIQSLCVMAFKRTIIDDGFDYSPYKFVSSNEDLLQILPIATNSSKAVYINKHLYYYRYNPKSTTKSFRPQKYKSISFVGSKLNEYMDIWDMKRDEKNLWDRNLTAAISAVAQTIGAKDCTWNGRQKKEYLRGVSGDNFFYDSYYKAERKSMGMFHRIYGWLLIKNKHTALIFVANLDRVFNLRDMRLLSKDFFLSMKTAALQHKV